MDDWGLSTKLRGRYRLFGNYGKEVWCRSRYHARMVARRVTGYSDVWLYIEKVEENEVVYEV